MNDLFRLIAGGLARAGVMALGGWLAARGYVDGSTATNIEGSLICLAGAGLTLASKFAIAGKIAAARAEVPPGYVPAPPGSSPGQAPATMQPIPNP